MTQGPGFADFEARLKAQEHTTAMLQARVEDLSKDMTASFRQQARYQVVIEQELELRFKHIDTRFDKVEASIASLEQRFTSLENKTDQRFTSLEQRFTSLENKFEQRFASLDNKFDSVLQLLTTLTKKLVE